MDYFLGGTRKPRENKFGACVGSRETGFWFAIGPGARGLVALLNLADLGVLRLAPFVAKPLGATLLIGRNSGWNRIQCVCVQDPSMFNVQVQVRDQISFGQACTEDPHAGVPLAGAGSLRRACFWRQFPNRRPSLASRHQLQLGDESPLRWCACTRSGTTVVSPRHSSVRGGQVTAPLNWMQCERAPVYSAHGSGHSRRNCRIWSRQSRK